jgi:acetyltransferase-like isoleucine patch superfamily enzyme
MIKKLLKLFTLYTKGSIVYARKLGVTIGENCRIYSVQFGSEPFLIKIGNHVTVTSGVKFITHDGAAWLMRDDKGRRYTYQPIEVGNHVFIGVNSIIMPGVKIDNKVIIAAGSVVTKSIPSGVIVAGTPAKIIGKYEDYEKKALSTFISDKEMDKSIPYKERILKILKNEFRPFLVNERNG